MLQRPIICYIVLTVFQCEQWWWWWCWSPQPSSARLYRPVRPPVVCRQGVVRRGSWKGWQIINILQQSLLLSWTSLDIYICNTYIFLKASLKITSNKFYILDRRSLYYKKLPKPSPICFLCFTLMLLNLRGKKIQLFWKFKESFLSKQWFFHFFCK